VTQLRPEQTRLIHLNALGLAHPASTKASKRDLLKCIRAMQLLQLDTISVVNRSHFLVLYARLGQFDLNWLDQILTDGSLFELWAHEACLAPKDNFWLLRAQMQDREHWSQKNKRAMHQTHGKELKQLISHIRKNGSVKSSDFERPAHLGERAGWWDWKPHKKWLEALFAAGDLMVAKREGFQRVYDLAQRVAPVLADSQAVRERLSALDATTRREQFILHSIKALGVTKARWVKDYYRLKRLVSNAELMGLVDQGKLNCVAVDNDSDPWFYHPTTKKMVEQVVSGKRPLANHCALLSPFDPLVWHRERAQIMFDFEYRIECYTPEHKRKFGYFCLPILWKDQIIGRLDAKAHRAQGIFEVKQLHFEKKTNLNNSLLNELGSTMKQFSHWHGCQSVKIGFVSSPGAIKKLREQTN
jgi:uncharacterized protein